MIPLSDMQPRSVPVIVTLQGGKEVELIMRPYNMADYAWFQENFGSEERQKEVAALRLEAIAEFCWNQLDPKSQLYFQNITYQSADEVTGEEVTVTVHGYRKLLYALHGEESFWKLFDAFLKCKGTNGFVSDEAKIGLKKKVGQQKKKKSTGLQYLTKWLQTMAIRSTKSSN